MALSRLAKGIVESGRRALSTSARAAFAEVQQVEQRAPTPTSKRTGVLAVKAGMTCDWDENGRRYPLTVLWIDDCQVTQVKTEVGEGYNALQLGAGYRKPKRTPRSQLKHFEQAGSPPRHCVAEFRVSQDALLPAGTALTAEHFVPGQYVDVSGKCKGKGFAGTIKRHGFSSQRASHGATQVHRKPGSIGAQGVGRVFRGKKLPGHMGNKRTTVHSLFLRKVDGRRNLLFLQGAVPGAQGSYIEVRDALRKPPNNPPFPTFLPDDGHSPSLRVAPSNPPPEQ